MKVRPAYCQNRKCQDYIYLKWEYWSTMQKVKHYLRYENKVNENQFKHDLQKVDQHTGGKWLIHNTKHHKDNQLQNLELPCRIS